MLPGVKKNMCLKQSTISLITWVCLWTQTRSLVRKEERGWAAQAMTPGQGQKPYTVDTQRGGLRVHQSLAWEGAQVVSIHSAQPGSKVSVISYKHKHLITGKIYLITLFHCHSRFRWCIHSSFWTRKPVGAFLYFLQVHNLLFKTHGA